MSRGQDFCCIRIQETRLYSYWLWSLRSGFHDSAAASWALKVTALPFNSELSALHLFLITFFFYLSVHLLCFRSLHCRKVVNHSRSLNTFSWVSWIILGFRVTLVLCCTTKSIFFIVVSVSKIFCEPQDGF